MFEFLDFKTAYILLHVFGVILGAGAAFVSDAIFFNTVRDGRINKDELRFMKLGSKIVWTGLVILVVSGILLVSMDPAAYLSSDKFLVKLTIVGVIIVNGIIFHLIHIPHVQNHIGIKFANSPTFIKKSGLIMISGGISFVSWISTVILGSVKQVPFGYFDILSVYLVAVLLAVIGALVMKKKILHLR